MLALSRKKNEALVINNNIEITVLEVKGEQVKLGISAPKEVPVYRKEVYVQIQEANTMATETAGIEALKNLFGSWIWGCERFVVLTIIFFLKNVYRKL